MTESMLIDGIRTGSEHRAFFEKELYQRYKYLIQDGCHKYNLSYDDSFSAYSDALLSVIHNIINNSYNNSASLKTYLFSIFSNKCVDLVRKKTTNKQVVNQWRVEPELLSGLPDNARNIVEKLIDQESIILIKRYLDTIGEKCKEILLLFEDGYSDKEIAEKLAYNNPAVAKTTRLRCREKLKNMFQNRE